MTDDRPVDGARVDGSRTPEGPLAPDTDEVPDFVAARDHVREELVRFVRALRRAGVAVPANATLTAGRALVTVGFEEERARAAMRAALLTRRADVEQFESMFPEFWRRLTAGLGPTGPADRPDDALDGGLAPMGDPVAGESPEGPDDPGAVPEGTTEATRSRVGGAPDGGETEAGEALTASTYSPTGTPSPVSVDPAAVATGERLDEAVRELTRAVAGLRGRRWAAGGDDRMDARRALRESFGTGGTVLSVPRRARKQTAVRGVLLVDVSQSVLDTIDRGFLVRFLRAVRSRWRHARVFFFDDRVREVTDAFDAPSVEAALTALDRAETEWGGGTRIGHAVDTVRRDHPDAVDRDTVAFVVSDGLEVGELDRLEGGMAWLSRRAAAVLWLNPLAASPEYEPAARGMETALPYVDGLFAFAGPDDVTELARQLRLRGTGGTVGYEQDPRRHRANADADAD